VGAHNLLESDTDLWRGDHLLHIQDQREVEGHMLALGHTAGKVAAEDLLGTAILEHALAVEAVAHKSCSACLPLQSVVVVCLVLVAREDRSDE